MGKKSKLKPEQFALLSRYLETFRALDSRPRNRPDGSVHAQVIVLGFSIRQAASSSPSSPAGTSGRGPRRGEPIKTHLSPHPLLHRMEEREKSRSLMQPCQLAPPIPLDAVSPLYCNATMFTKSSLLSAARNSLGALLGCALPRRCKPKPSPDSPAHREQDQTGRTSTSTIDMEGGIVGGSSNWIRLSDRSGGDQRPDAGKINARGSARIPVRSVKSGKTRMDEVMQEHMKENDFPASNIICQNWSSRRRRAPQMRR